MRNNISASNSSTNCLLVYFGELILKGGNRSWFFEKLLNNIRVNLRGLSVSRIENLSGRIIIDLKEAYPIEALAERLSRVFGVSGFAPAFKAGGGVSDVESMALSCLSKREIGSFCVRAKRVDKRLPFSSQDVNIKVGAAICEKFGAKVNLKDPDTTVWADILKDRSYIYVDKFQGAGGLPVGTSGRVLSLISGGIDSPVASWRMMRRGCVVDFLHFHSAPFTDEASIEKVKEIVEKLMGFETGFGRFAMIPLGNIQKKIVTKTLEQYRVILYRRFMIRIACEVAKKIKAESLVTGESLGQVASQTLSNMATVESVSTLPVLRPLVGMDKQEIVDTAVRIGTYDLSILPHKDCCQFLEPRHPVTHSTSAELEEVEKELNIEELVKEGLTGTEFVDI